MLEKEAAKLTPAAAMAAASNPTCVHMTSNQAAGLRGGGMGVCDLKVFPFVIWQCTAASSHHAMPVVFCWVEL